MNFNGVSGGEPVNPNGASPVSSDPLISKLEKLVATRKKEATAASQVAQTTGNNLTPESLSTVSINTDQATAQASIEDPLKQFNDQFGLGATQSVVETPAPTATSSPDAMRPDEVSTTSSVPFDAGVMTAGNLNSADNLSSAVEAAKQPETKLSLKVEEFLNSVLAAADKYRASEEKNE